MKISKEEIIETFSEPGLFLAVGISRKEKHFSRYVLNELKAKGYTVVPINPHAKLIDEEPCFASIEQALKTHDRQDLKGALLFTPKNETVNVVKQLLDLEIEPIWVQQGAESKELQTFLDDKPDKKVLTRKCIMMYASPVTGFHRFHRGLARLTGSYTSGKKTL